MTKKANQTWVSPAQGEWKVHHAGAKRASGIYPTKEQAVAAGRKISQNQRTELIVQNKDGQIGFRDSHGHDPRNIKG